MDITKKDKEMIAWLINHFECDLKELQNDKYGHTEIVEDLKDSCRQKIKWLKSLQERASLEEHKN